LFASEYGGTRALRRFWPQDTRRILMSQIHPVTVTLRRPHTLSSSQFTIPVCPTPSQSCTVKHDALTHTTSSPFKVFLRNSHVQLLLPTLFLQVFKSYYLLQQNCLICLLHNDRVLRQLLPSGKRINNYQSVLFYSDRITTVLKMLGFCRPNCTVA